VTAPTPLAPYDALSAVYDRWTAHNDYPRWAARIDELFCAHGDVRRVLDLCCGTGSITALLQKQGREVAGVDGSPGMLEQARARTAPGTELLHVQLPAPLPLPAASFDAAVCSFDSVNYFRPDQLTPLFACVAQVLRPGGLFVFDVNTRHKLENVLGDSHYGDDLDDFAYVWRNRYHGGARRCDFAISLFTRGPEGFVKQTEQHAQWWFEPADIRCAAQAAGFAEATVTEDYRGHSPGPRAMRETWTLVLAADPARPD
jgi:SAM-dependent methyltransferase